MSFKTNIVVYSKERNQGLTRERNKYFCRNFDNDEPTQSLRDFSRVQYLGRKYKTVGKSEDEISRRIDKFVGATNSGEQAALAKFLKARGGQGLTEGSLTEMSNQLTTNILSHPDDRPVFGAILSLATYQPSTRKTIERLDIIMPYVIVENGVFKKMNPSGTGLEIITADETANIKKAISEFEEKIFNNKEYQSIQRRMTNKTDLSTVSILIQNVIHQKLGYLPVAYANSRSRLTGYAEDNWRVSFDKSGNVEVKTEELIIGSNTPEIYFKPEFLQENRKEKTYQEFEDEAFLRRSLDTLNTVPLYSDQNDIDIDEDELDPLTWLYEEFIMILNKMLSELSLIEKENECENKSDIEFTLTNGPSQ